MASTCTLLRHHHPGFMSNPPRRHARAVGTQASAGTAEELTASQAQARFYMLPRALEALRLRGASSDALAAALFPEDEATTRAYALGRELMARQRAAIQEGTYRAVPGSTIAPTPDTPLCTRGVAVDRFVDDELLCTLHKLRERAVGAHTPAKFQVVDLGCGLSTRPWSLPPLPGVSWFDVDRAEVLSLKASLLGSAGAQLEQHPVHVDLNGASPPRAAFPLKPDSYARVEADVTAAGWVQECLVPAGFDPGVPTVWLAVALVYYLPEPGVAALMRSVVSATREGVPATFLGTVMNQGMVQLIASFQGAKRPPPDADGGQAGSASASQRLAGGKEVKAAVDVQFGVTHGIPAFLKQYGWSFGEEITVGQVELAYNCLTVGLDYPEELRAAAREASGCKPACSVALARNNF